ncbi:hypothetical protein BASA81_012362 [Batrachochytrium salamandrivorans]|nr:hypothetical protein BASA81_012362 [Batrachochytrium salamandrivorans]
MSDMTSSTPAAATAATAAASGGEGYQLQLLLSPPPPPPRISRAESPPASSNPYAATPSAAPGTSDGNSPPASSSSAAAAAATATVGSGGSANQPPSSKRTRSLAASKISIRDNVEIQVKMGKDHFKGKFCTLEDWCGMHERVILPWGFTTRWEPMDTYRLDDDRVVAAFWSCNCRDPKTNGECDYVAVEYSRVGESKKVSTMLSNHLKEKHSIALFKRGVESDAQPMQPQQPPQPGSGLGHLAGIGALPPPPPPPLPQL